MASNADITAQLALCTALGLTDQQMVDLARRAKADLLSSGRPTVGYRVNGQEFTFSLFQAQQLEAYHQERVDGRGAAQMRMSTAEFG
ncbi:MAG: hypothetical protein H0W72_05390 [Planctomycetes bacterium]|nr:hypothetical protein [Planctomycetota bacterium]